MKLAKKKLLQLSLTSSKTIQALYQNESPATAELNIKAATVNQKNKISLNAKKATGPVKVPVKVVKMPANI